MLVHREAYHAGGLSRPRVILTIHNMDNSGECRQDEFAYCGTNTAPCHQRCCRAVLQKAIAQRTGAHVMGLA